MINEVASIQRVYCVSTTVSGVLIVSCEATVMDCLRFADQPIPLSLKIVLTNNTPAT